MHVLCPAIRINDVVIRRLHPMLQEFLTSAENLHLGKGKLLQFVKTIFNGFIVGLL
jgi:hypothetical protein